MLPLPPDRKAVSFSVACFYTARTSNHLMRYLVFLLWGGGEGGVLSSVGMTSCFVNGDQPTLWASSFLPNATTSPSQRPCLLSPRLPLRLSRCSRHLWACFILCSKRRKEYFTTLSLSLSAWGSSLSLFVSPGTRGSDGLLHGSLVHLRQPGVPLPILLLRQRQRENVYQQAT